MYVEATGDRLPISDEAGERLPEDRILLGENLLSVEGSGDHD